MCRKKKKKKIKHYDEICANKESCEGCIENIWGIKIVYSTDFSSSWNYNPKWLFREMISGKYENCREGERGELSGNVINEKC